MGLVAGGESNLSFCNQEVGDDSRMENVTCSSVIRWVWYLEGKCNSPFHNQVGVTNICDYHNQVGVVAGREM